jgi:uncharacterized membrane-anchored protein YitT (DUF2179 family)
MDRLTHPRPRRPNDAASVVSRAQSGILAVQMPRRKVVRDYGLLTLGAVVQATSMDLFLIPGKLASGGVSGLSMILNRYTGLPIGAMVLVMNAPLLLLGLRHLGGWRFSVRTIFTVVLYSLFVDVGLHLARRGPTANLMLDALYGGVIGGMGAGLTFLGQGTTGGTDILARILARLRGVPLSQSYLLTDGLVVILAGFAFGWEQALYALIALYVSGLAAEVVTEGVGVVRTAIVVSQKPREVADAILGELGRGVTGLHGEGMYTGESRTVLYCIISRSEVTRLKALIQEIDAHAFVVIGHASEALGEGFRPLKE